MLNQRHQTQEVNTTTHNKIISLLLSIVLVIVLLFMIISFYTFIQVKFIRKTYSHFAGIIALSEQTESMLPTINVGDIVFVTINNNSLKDKDIIAYYDNDYVITHRLIEIKENDYITLGDNPNSGRETISKDKIIGKVIYVWKFSIWKKTFASPTVFIPLLLTIMMASFTILEFRKEKIDRRRKDGEEKS